VAFVSSQKMTFMPLDTVQNGTQTFVPPQILTSPHKFWRSPTNLGGVGHLFLHHIAPLDNLSPAFMNTIPIVLFVPSITFFAIVHLLSRTFAQFLLSNWWVWKFVLLIDSNYGLLWLPSKSTKKHYVVLCCVTTLERTTDWDKGCPNCTCICKWTEQVLCFLIDVFN